MSSPETVCPEEDGGVQGTRQKAANRNLVALVENMGDRGLACLSSGDSPVRLFNVADERIKLAQNS